MSGTNSDHLFEGILQGARSEAASILERAKQDASSVQVSYDRKIADARAQEEKATRTRLDQIRRYEESTIKNLQRRHMVSRSERLRHLVLDAVMRKMDLLRDTPEYRVTLIGWIAEAAIGLDRNEAVVACSFRESIDEGMLRRAEELVKRATGKQVHLRLSDTPLTGQGVQVSTPDGKIAYSNQVSTRLIRYERNLKELMEGQPCRKE